MGRREGEGITDVGVNWLEKETNRIKKKLMKFNMNKFGSPFNIAASGLDISADELNEKLNNYINKYNHEVS